MTPFLHLPITFCSFHRKPCLKASSYSTATPAPTKGTPIQVVPKPKRQKWLQNIFLDDRGFPDQSNEFDQLLHNIDGGPVLRKFWHLMANLDGPIDLCFHSPFIPKQHEDWMWKQVDLSHFKPNFQEQVYNLIHKYWSVFDKWGVFIPVKYYECVINTGTPQPITVKKTL